MTGFDFFLVYNSDMAQSYDCLSLLYDMRNVAICNSYLIDDWVKVPQINPVCQRLEQFFHSWRVQPLACITMSQD